MRKIGQRQVSASPVQCLTLPCRIGVFSVPNPPFLFTHVSDLTKRQNDKTGLNLSGFAKELMRVFTTRAESNRGGMLVRIVI